MFTHGERGPPGCQRSSGGAAPPPAGDGGAGPGAGRGPSPVFFLLFFRFWSWYLFLGLAIVGFPFEASSCGVTMSMFPTSSCSHGLSQTEGPC